MTERPMAWKPSPVPTKNTRTSTYWERVVPADLIRAMRANPAQTFQLLDDDGEPAEMLKADVETLRSSCKRPYRVQARRVKGRDTHLLVWVSMDPGHWEYVDKNYLPKGPRRKEPNQ